jgi:hypothetical protein
MNRSNWLLQLVLILIIFTAGFFIAKTVFEDKKEHVKEDSVILMEQLKTVSKLITVEAYFNELYTYQDYYKFNWFPFQKKAIIRVRAKVSAGYDLGQMQFETNAATKTITMFNIPKPTILSLDHSLDYYDLQEGVFNEFGAADLSKMNAKAKELIYQKAMESLLLVEAAKKGISMIESMKQIAKQAGWNLVVKR